MAARGCNVAAITFLFIAMLFPTTNPDIAITAAVIAAACAVVGALLNFQAMFEKWEVSHVSFHMKQIGMRGKRGKNE
jgi:hypothetical protein